MHHTDSEISRTMRFTPPGKASNGNMVFVCGGNEWLSGVQMVRELSYTALIFKRSAFYTFLRTGWLSPFMCIRFHIIFITTLTCLIPVNYLNRATWCLDLETAFFFNRRVQRTERQLGARTTTWSSISANTNHVASVWRCMSIKF